MNFILSVVAVNISIVGAVLIWHAFLIKDGHIDMWTLIIWFVCMGMPGVIRDLYEDTLWKKYEYPNRKKEITYEGKIYKKNTFEASGEFKGYPLCSIIVFIGALPLIWWAISSLYSVLITFLYKQL